MPHELRCAGSRHYTVRSLYVSYHHYNSNSLRVVPEKNNMYVTHKCAYIMGTLSRARLRDHNIHPPPPTRLIISSHFDPRRIIPNLYGMHYIMYII